MTTAIEMLGSFGIFFAGMFVRAAIVFGTIALLSLPFVAYAYVARAAESFWHRHHNGSKHVHGVA